MNQIKNISHVLALAIFLSFAFSLQSAIAAKYDDADYMEDEYGAKEAYAPDEVYDPVETVNRAIYGFNDFLDKILLKPVAEGYRYIVPKPVRKGVHNALSNLKEPVTVLNSALQGDKENSFTSFWRFTINSTWGILGIFDVASEAGLPLREEDYGQTAGVYGAGNGPYLMLPILGPSNARDVFGRVVDTFTDPFNYALHDDATVGRSIVTGIDARERTLDLIDEIKRTSLDPYAAIRSLYTQKRADEIANGADK